MIRIASFNVENMFSRAAVMNAETWEDQRTVLNDIQILNDLLSRPTYDARTKKSIAKILTSFGFDNRNMKGRPFGIVESHGKLFKVRQSDKQIEVVAKGRQDWLGWIELAREQVEEPAIDNTARVIQELNADILLLVEVESRPILERFNRDVLSRYMTPYPHAMLIDGNDDRGIDVGLLSRYPIVNMRSHVDDREEGDTTNIFSRDCPEFEFALPDGRKLLLLGNHFKSKGYGDKGQSDAKRLRQASRVAKIFAERSESYDNIAICGDLNDTPNSKPLAPLLKNKSLNDVMSHASYSGLPGTYGTGASINQKIDYILLSPQLWKSVAAVDVERRGVYVARNKKRFETVTSSATAASDHAALWVDVDL